MHFYYIKKKEDYIEKISVPSKENWYFIEDTKELVIHNTVWQFYKYLDSSITSDLSTIISKFVQVDSSINTIEEDLTEIVKYTDTISDASGKITIPEIPSNREINIISITYLHPSLNIYVPALVYENALYAAEHAQVFLAGAPMKTYADTSARVYYNLGKLVS